MTSTDKLKKSQILKLFLIASLLIVTPLLSSSLRSTYLYFIANILILIVGAEAGLLSIFSTLAPPNNKRPSSSSSSSSSSHELMISPDDDHEAEQCSRRIEKYCSSDKVVGEEKKMAMIKKSAPSMPSIFFIDQPEDGDVVVDGDEGEEIGEVSGQELFQKAETFIGDFYKQLKMQREESWKKLHDFCHNTF